MTNDEHKWYQSMDATGEQQQKQLYNTVDNLEEHINNQMRTCNHALNVSQMKFSKMLATIGLMKDDTNCVLKEYGNLYRWQWQYTRDMNKDAEACCAFNHLSDVEKNLDDQNPCLLPDGWRWMLQVKTGDRWFDWVYIKASNRIDEHLGLFAARDFPRGSMLGFFIGPNVPDYELNKKHDTGHRHYFQSKTGQSAFPLKLKHNNGSWNIIQPLRVDNFPGIPLYLGMHYINSACQFFKFGTKEFEAAIKNQNCMINDDGSVQTLKNITKDMELLAGYTSVERKTGKCDKTKKRSRTSDYKATASTCIKQQSHTT